MRRKRAAIDASVETAWPPPERRHPRASLVRSILGPAHASVVNGRACSPAIIGHENYQRIASQTRLVQLSKQPPDVFINVLDHSIELRHIGGHLRLIVSNIFLLHVQRSM